MTFRDFQSSISRFGVESAFRRQKSSTVGMLCTGLRGARTTASRTLTTLTVALLGSPTEFLWNLYDNRNDPLKQLVLNGTTHRLRRLTAIRSVYV